jgi:hypothetical protein
MLRARCRLRAVKDEGRADPPPSHGLSVRATLALQTLPVLLMTMCESRYLALFRWEQRTLSLRLRRLSHRPDRLLGLFRVAAGGSVPDPRVL